MKQIISNATIGKLCWIILAYLLNPVTSTCQRPVHWLGGTPGMETNWYCHKNWSTGRVPDNLSIVYILDVRTSFQSLPVVPHGKIVIHELWIANGASVQISSGASLFVTNKIYQYYPDQVKGKGILKGPDNIRAGFDTVNARAYKYPLQTETNPLASNKGPY
jgi:hypothetical protein